MRAHRDLDAARTRASIIDFGLQVGSELNAFRAEAARLADDPDFPPTVRGEGLTGEDGIVDRIREAADALTLGDEQDITVALRELGGMVALAGQRLQVAYQQAPGRLAQRSEVPA